MRVPRPTKLHLHRQVAAWPGPTHSLLSPLLERSVWRGASMELQIPTSPPAFDISIIIILMEESHHCSRCQHLLEACAYA